MSERGRRLPSALWSVSMLLLAAALTLTVANWRYEEEGWSFIPLAVAMLLGYSTRWGRYSRPATRATRSVGS